MPVRADSSSLVRAAGLAGLAMCGGVPIKKWLKWLLPVFILWWVAAFTFMIIAVQIGYGPF